MKSCRLLILTAVTPEARAIARAFHLRRGFDGEGRMWGDERTCVAVAGIRAARLARVLAVIEPQAILMTGLAGALSPDLRVGDVVCEAPVPGVSVEGFRVHVGRIYTSPAVVATPREKAELFGRTGAVAVDMETEIAAGYARERNIAFHAVRAVSDGAGDPLDPELLTLIDGEGNPRLARVAGLLVRRPGKLAGLLRIKRATDLALGNLGHFLVEATATGWPSGSQIVSPSPPNPLSSLRMSKVL